MKDQAWSIELMVEMAPDDTVKEMAKVWGGTPRMIKEQSIAAIRQGLADPKRVRSVVAALEPFERDTLALIKQAGGVCHATKLGLAVYGMGHPMPQWKTQPYESDSLVVAPLNHLILKGLAIPVSDYDTDMGSSYYGPQFIASDPRILEAIGEAQPKPLDINPVPFAGPASGRPPQIVCLELMRVISHIHEMGSIPLTARYKPRSAFLKQLGRATGIATEAPDMEGLPFPEPLLALSYAFMFSSLCRWIDHTPRVAMAPGDLAAQPYHSLVSAFLYGLIGQTGWNEMHRATPLFFSAAELAMGRLALLVALQALPANTAGYFTLDDLSEALFARIGARFVSSWRQSPSYAYGSEKARRAAEESYRTQLKKTWDQTERVWIECALRTWLYYLGIVELALEEGKLVGLRLTDLGREILHPRLRAGQASDPPARHDAWVVQPNLEVVVFVDHVTPRQLVTLERFVERVQVQEHAGHYRLTKLSVYEGLEHGMPLEQMLALLEAGSTAALPQNVVREMREWAALREQIVLTPRATLLEFASAEARQQAQPQVSGEPVGDRFLLLRAIPEELAHTAHAVNYALAPPRDLTVDEHGLVKAKARTRDLLLRPQLDIWARHDGQGRWRLTADSVREARQQGRRIGDLIELLQQRSAQAIPPITVLTLHAWGDTGPRVEIKTLVALHYTDYRVPAALEVSERFGPYVKGRLSNDMLLVSAEDLDILRSMLEEAGFSVTVEA